eukprot:Em0006g1388a
MDETHERTDENEEREFADVHRYLTEEFMLENRLDAIATDQGANFVAAIRQLIEEGVTEEQDDGATQSEDDSDHTIDATQSEDAEIDRTLHVDASVLPHRRSLKLIKDICTRWNSTSYILQRCVLLQKHITHVLAESKYAHLVPSPEQWLAAEKLCALLKPFQIATDFLQGEKYPTLGCVSRYITTLVDGLQEMMNIAEENEEDEADEPPAKKAAVTQQEEEFDILFGHKNKCPGEVMHSTHDHIEDEFQRYLKEAEINFRIDDPMDWWRKHESYFLQVAKLARKYLAIPASTAPSERVFSTAKNILQKKRWSLLPERLGKCIFLRHNAKWF